MRLTVTVLQVIAALGLLNVWVLRSRRSTAYRGGEAATMREEFAAYGLPSWFLYLIGALKIGAAVALLAGIWLPQLVAPAALLVAVLMFGALAMHLKIGDPTIKFLPAAAMLALSILILMAASRW